MKYTVILFLVAIALIYACKKKETTTPAGDITLVSLTSTQNPVKAWDTTIITTVATGSNLQYGWEANHGNITGSGQQIKYAAGECCVGLNTITCRVFNEAGEVSDTIMIRVTSYFGP